MGAFQSYGIFWRRALFAALTAGIIAAIIIQDHTGYLPLGVFNTGSATMAKLSLGCLAAAGVVLVIQVIEMLSGRLAPLGGTIRGIYVFLVILDVLLIFGDRVFVTGNPAGRLGQYYEVPDSGQPPVILKKDPTGLPVRQCLSDADSLLDGPRILFLGDSYTAGSGSGPACNYPDVAERVLRLHWLSTAEVVNAGVSGYGPVEALSMLRWYRAQDCPLNAIVYNLTLENDFADNLPGTERRVAAGIIFRFPHNWFLKHFHPLNTRLFRWALVVVYFGRASTQDMLNAVSVPGGPCDFTVKPVGEVSPFLRSTVQRDLDNATRVATTPGGYDEAKTAIDEMRTIAAEMKVPFFLVVFPDRVLADAELRARMNVGAPDASIKNHGVAVSAFHADRIFDVYELLDGRAGMYREVDTHLSDLGNVAAGEFVGSGLAAYLKQMTAPDSTDIMKR
ncbi:MAG TPA: hypothetical protein VF247_12830 [Candidatus Krumholzibacteria bacterium]